jgi:hypothetical protein
MTGYSTLMMFIDAGNLNQDQLSNQGVAAITIHYYPKKGLI